VDVENALRESVEQRALHQPQEPGEADEIDARGQQALGGFLLRLLGKFRAETAAVDDAGVDAAPARAFEDEGLRVVGEHEGDARVERAGVDRVEDRLHVGSGT
jgi:hypothetical protein